MRRVLGRGRDGRGGGRDSGRLRGPSLRLRLCFIVIFDVTLNGGEVVETYKYGNVAWHASPSKANVPSFAHQTSISSLFCSLHLLVSVTSPNNSLNLGSHPAKIPRISSRSAFCVLIISGSVSGHARTMLYRSPPFNKYPTACESGPIQKLIAGVSIRESKFGCRRISDALTIILYAKSPVNLGGSFLPSKGSLVTDFNPSAPITRSASNSLPSPNWTAGLAKSTPITWDLSFISTPSRRASLTRTRW